jgi:hypothetical protein
MVNILYFDCIKKNSKKSQGGGYKSRRFKNDVNDENDIYFPRMLTTTPSLKLTLGTIYSKKSPQMPPNPLQGGLVYRIVTIDSF